MFARVRKSLVLLFPLLPVVVAAADLGPGSAALLVIAVLLGLWAAHVGATLVPSGPELRLETIRPSHFVEKVRWCLDRLGTPYVETPWVGVVGAFLLGRTVPVLHIRTGMVISRIGNSPEILRYLWGRYGEEGGARAAFLRPTAEAVELERCLDSYGVALQRWAYHHLLDQRRTTLRLWGAYDPELPAWQRFVVRATYPFLRAFISRVFRLQGLSDGVVAAPVEETLADMDRRLALSPEGLLGPERSYVDYTFAALSGLWLLPDEYGAGRIGRDRPRRADMPPAMARQARSWAERFPHATAFVERLYREERIDGARERAGAE